MVSPKVKSALIAGLLFFIIANPIVYKLVDGLIGGLVGRIVAPCGCPTTLGLIVHSAVFAALAVYGLGL